MQKLFQHGEQVKLKSGGPVMTIHKEQSEEAPMHVVCSWFGDGFNEAGTGDNDLHKEPFRIETLVKVEP